MSFPKSLSREAVDLLRGLLEKNPQERLGFKNGMDEIKKCDFLKNIDFVNLAKKKV